MPSRRPRTEREVQLVRVPGADIVAETYAEVRAWPIIRYRLYAFFKCCSEAGRMTARYGERTESQIRGAIDGQNG